nr:hypothetical protein [Microvirga sp.]
MKRQVAGAALSATEIAYGAGSVHLDVQPVGIGICRVGATGLDLAGFAGAGSSTGPYRKF